MTTHQSASSASNGAASRAESGQDRTARNLSLDERRERIIELSSHLFLDKGYDKVSMNHVIDAAGGSKATIYQLFGNKEGLFVAVVQRMATRAIVSIDLDPGGALEDQLAQIGQSFVEAVLGPEILELHRLMVSMGKTFPNATRLFFDAGPRNAYRHVAVWFENRQKSGDLAPGDAQERATLFLDMLLGDFQLGMLTNGEQNPSPADIKKRAGVAARIFLHGCSAR